MDKIVIPSSLQITMDDVGWFNGADDRKNGGSAHTAMPRRHCAEDYAAINELGRRLNMKINCAFVLGEWDDDNRLRNIKYLSKYKDNWNNAAYLTHDEIKAVTDTVNASLYIDVAVHGLLHNYYNPDAPYSNTDYYYTLEDGRHMIPEDEIRARLDAFFDILNHHQINKAVNSFIPPAFVHTFDTISRILSDYGIKYISTLYSHPSMQAPEDFDRSMSASVENGIILLNRNNNFIPWYEVSANLDECEAVHGIFGCHWPNILHEDPSRHGEIIDNWVRYFERCADTYGIILSRDIAFAASQSIYKEYARVTYCGREISIDISNVPKACGLGDRFYISSKSGITKFTGCELSVHECRPGFVNYEVVPFENTVTFTV